jgi:flagellar basal body-associated protein FliL
MRKISWILIMVVMVSLSGRLMLNNHSTGEECHKQEKKKQTNRQEEEALGTMMLLPVSFNMEVNLK